MTDKRAVIMIVCHCFSVSDRQIRQCAKEGACTTHDVGRACGAGTGCGGCRPEIANIVDDVQKAQAPAVGLLPILQTG
jgi:bacterioferritin-associated ferredoxin